MSEPGDEELERDAESWTPGGSPLDRAVFNADGLLPAVIQQWNTGELLMLGWMDREAMRRTLTEGRVTFWSRSRQEYWRKGDTSGHVQYVRAAALDCDADTLVVQVEQVGAACHTGTHSCFDGDPLEVVQGHPAAD
jgi:phosphoribosyl-AMP cyclohydrolase